MIFFLFLIWLLLPLVLIPVSIINGVQASKLKKELKELKAGLPPQNLPAAGATLPVNGSQPYRQAYPRTVSPPQSPLPDYQVSHSAPKYSGPVNYSPLPKKETNPTKVVMLAGAAFIILAGLIFVTAAWAVLGAAAKIAIILFAALFFLGMSAVAGKIFRLSDTGSAFWIIGSAFIPTAFITASYYSLFGQLLSVRNGEALYTIGIALGIFSLMCVPGFLIYKKQLFSYTGLISLAAAIFLVFLEAAPKSAVFALFTALLSAAAAICRDRIKALPLPLESVLLGYSIFCGVFSLACLVLANFVNDPLLFIWSGLLVLAAEVFYFTVRKKDLTFKVLAALIAVLCIGELHISLDRLLSEYSDPLSAFVPSYVLTEAATVLTVSLLAAAGVVFALSKAVRTEISDTVFPFLSLGAVLLLSPETEYIFFLLALLSALPAYVSLCRRSPEEMRVISDGSHSVALSLVPLAGVIIGGFVLLDNTTYFPDSLEAALCSLLLFTLPYFSNYLFRHFGRRRLDKWQIYLYTGAAYFGAAISALFADSLIELISPLILSVFYYILARKPEEKYLFAFPLAVFLTTVISACRLAAFDTLIVSTAALIITAAGIVFPKRSSRVFILIHELLGGLTLLSAVRFTHPHTLEYIPLFTVSVLLFACFMASKNQLTALLPSAALLIEIYDLSKVLLPEEIRGRCILILMLAAGAALLAVSRIFYSDHLVKYNRETGKLYADVFEMLLPVSLFLCLFGADTGILLIRTKLFATSLLFSLAVFNLYRKNSPVLSSLAVTAGTVCASIALCIRPEIINLPAHLMHKISCIFIIGAALVLKLWWKKRSAEAGDVLSFLMLIFAGLILTSDALTGGFPDFILVILYALGILALSFVIKRKKHLTFAIVLLSLIFLYSIRGFLAMLGWWVYLLFVGILLVLCAAVNEFLKTRKGSSSVNNWKW